MNTITRTATPTESAIAPMASRRGAWVEAGLAVTAFALVSIGFSGLGDAPDPHGSAIEIADWFTSRRSEILRAAPFGYLGALSLVALAALLAQRLGRADRAFRSRVLIAGSIITATYLAGAQVAWSSNAYLVADSSPQASKALFVLSIVSVPVLAAGLSLMVGAAAWRAATADRRWWRAASAGIAATSSVGVLAIADHGFLSPDVQQQMGGNLLLAWLLVTAVAAVLSRTTTTAEVAPYVQEATS